MFVSVLYEQNTRQRETIAMHQLETIPSTPSRSQIPAKRNISCFLTLGSTLQWSGEWILDRFLVMFGSTSFIFGSYGRVSVSVCCFVCVTISLCAFSSYDRRRRQVYGSVILFHSIKIPLFSSCCIYFILYLVIHTHECGNCFFFVCILCPLHASRFLV